MGLTSIKIGKYIEEFSDRCNIANLTIDDISGINQEKEFFEPSHQIGKDTSKYKIVPPGYFACNLMHVGRDMVLPIAFNHSESNKIVSPAYNIFRLLDNNEILKEYFFMYLKCHEKDRFFWFNTDSSIRDGMSWSDFVNIEIQVPHLDIQQKFINVYNALIYNQKNYERGLLDLKFVCDAFFDKNKKKNLTKIGSFIQVNNKKNQDLLLGIEALKGISDKYKFSETTANINIKDLDKYLIIRDGEYAVNFMCLGNWGKFYLAYNDSGSSYLVSPACSALKINPHVKLNPYYFLGILQRDEFQRKCVFVGDGNTRGGINNNDFLNMEIPMLPLVEQQTYADVFQVLNYRKEINDKLKSLINDICPVLIKGSIEEGT